ncbi:MAG TPA: hypothetical protein VMG35_08245 [Bryobacteraceae bacterium]|nr:hypothetical protein [Bryobacteraceae bacterium]
MHYKAMAALSKANCALIVPALDEEPAIGRTLDRVVEVPVSYRRRVGTSKISGNWRASVAAGAKILWTAVRLMAAR